MMRRWEAQAVAAAKADQKAAANATTTLQRPGAQDSSEEEERLADPGKDTAILPPSFWASVEALRASGQGNTSLDPQRTAAAADTKAGSIKEGPEPPPRDTEWEEDEGEGHRPDGTVWSPRHRIEVWNGSLQVRCGSNDMFPCFDRASPCACRWQQAGRFAGASFMLYVGTERLDFNRRGQILQDGRGVV